VDQPLLITLPLFYTYIADLKLNSLSYAEATSRPSPNQDGHDRFFHFKDILILADRVEVELAPVSLRYGISGRGEGLEGCLTLESPSPC